MIDTDKIKSIVEASLLAADQPLTSEQIVKLFARGEMPRADVRELVKAALDELEGDSKGRGVELKRVASGYRMQVKQDLSPWVSRLWDEKPPRYSRALLETLALVAYRQPVTRGDVEQVRGVAVSQNIMRTLTERGWVKVVGQREVPGRPSMYGTTKEFLDYFNLKSLSELPPLAEIRDLIEPVIVEEVLPPQTELKLVNDDGEVDSDAQAVADDEAAAIFAPEDDANAADTKDADTQDADAQANDADVEADVEADEDAVDDEMVDEAAEVAAQTEEIEETGEIEAAQDADVDSKSDQESDQDSDQATVAEVDFADDELSDTAPESEAQSADGSEDEAPVSAEVVQLPRAPRG